MAYCAHCGSFVDENAQFCGSCGAKQGEQFEATQQAYETSQQYYQPEVKPVSKKSSILSMAFGIASIVCGILSIYIMVVIGVFFLAAAIVFMILAKKQRNKYIALAGSDNAFSRVGKITSTIAIPVTIVFALIGVLYLALIASAM